MINRRELLLVGAGIVAAKATASTLACAGDGNVGGDEKKGDKKPDKKDAKAGGDAKADPHAGHGGDKAGGEGPGSRHTAFVAAVGGCLVAGDACLQHCLELLASGDKSMGECGKLVNQMLAVCRAVGALAVGDSKHLSKIAQLCHDVCTDCEAECQKHAGHHAECKACAEACKLSIAEAKKLV